MRVVGLELEQSDSGICAVDYYAVLCYEKGLVQYLALDRLSIPVSSYLSYYEVRLISEHDCKKESVGLRRGGSLVLKMLAFIILIS